MNSLCAVAGALVLGASAPAQTVDWLLTYQYPDARTNTGNFIKIDPFGSIFVAGQMHRNVAPTVDDALFKWSPNGAREFETWLDGGNDWPVGFGLDANQNLVMAGVWGDPGGDPALDRPLLWGTNSSSGYRFAFAEVNGVNNGIAVEPSGQFVTIGTDTSPQVPRIRRYNANGTGLWSRAYALASYDMQTGLSVSEDDLGNIYALTNARRISDGRLEIKTLKYSPAGVRLWAHSFTLGLGFNEGVKVLAKPTGGCIVAGYTWDGGSRISTNSLVYSLSEAGVLEWKKTYDSPDHLDEYVVDLAMAPSGEIVVTGNSFTPTNKGAVFTIKYAPNGDKIWLARYKSTYGAGPNSVAIAGDGSVYVAGLLWRTTGVDKYSSLVLKYGAAGTVSWTHKYFKINGGSAEASAVAVDSNGNAVVTGWAETILNNSTAVLLFKIH